VALYGVLTLLLAAYVHAKFRRAGRTLKMLQAEWQNAESTHAAIAGLAQEKLTRLGARAAAPMAQTGGIGLDLRNQVVAMAKRGIAANQIARTCGLHEGEVEVILGAVRLQR
jgi:hypothetical protein